MVFETQRQLRRSKSNILTTLHCGCPFSRNNNYKDVKSEIIYTRLSPVYKSNSFLTTLVMVLMLTRIEAGVISKREQIFCNQSKVLNSHQKNFCLKNPGVVKALEDGYKRGYQECQKAFQNSAVTGTRWNCTVMAQKDKKNVFFGVPAPRSGSREGSALSGFTAAGMLYNLVERCKKGLIKTCQPSILYTCPLNSHKLYSTRTSCKHINWEIPMTLLRDFFSQREENLRSDINDHNRNIGYRVVKSLGTIKRKCAFCAEQEELRPLENIHKVLVEHYKASVKLKKRNLVDQRIPTDIKLFHHNKFLHFRGRFSYCGYNPIWRWTGIGRRECKEITADIFDIENCVNMCCGFGYIVVSKDTRVCAKTSTGKICKIKTIEKYYCKYGNEARRRPADDHVWHDPPSFDFEKDEDIDI